MRGGTTRQYLRHVHAPTSQTQKPSADAPPDPSATPTSQHLRPASVSSSNARATLVAPLVSAHPSQQKCFRQREVPQPTSDKQSLPRYKHPSVYRRDHRRIVRETCKAACP